MAKAKFNKAEIIEKSTALFWHNGFSGSSMQDVSKATGLQPGSIYLAFGNKEGLYKEAMTQYTDFSKTQLRDIFEKSPSVGHALCKILEEKIEAAQKPDYCSCLLVKTTLELAEKNKKLHAFATKKLAEIESLYVFYLKKEYDDETSRIYATNIMMHIFGLRVYGYTKKNTDEIRQALKTALPWLPWDN